MSSKPGILIGAAAALVAIAALHSDPASAGQLQEKYISSKVTPDTEVNHMVVSYGDLNLKRSADVATLYHRIDVAAGFACGSRYFTGSRAVSSYWTACKTRAVNNAIASLDRQELTAYAQRQELLTKANQMKANS